jgi:peptidoglycan/xylan/chitin deacetylase (PgdA/CDA1 family)
LTPLIRRALAGRGTILMLHEVQRDPAAELMSGTGAAFLDDALRWLRHNGHDIVTMDEALDRLSRPERPRPFVVLTFDDGYRDNRDVALPILEAHGAPFTIYVPTAAIDRTLFSWWLGVRALILSADTVEIEPMGRRLDCSGRQQKIGALNEVVSWVRRDPEHISMLGATFRRAGLSLAEINERYFLGADDLKALAAHPLATIGAHTATHPILATLESDAVRSEMSDNRARLEGLIGKPVRHLAYPYGNPRACGPREAAIAAAVGFHSAVTTSFRKLNENSHRFLLPRLAIGADHTLTRFEAGMLGLLYRRGAPSASARSPA